jgi:uncharacterized membrane protein YdjX (TVP38/TMEM64 family)
MSLLAALAPRRIVATVRELGALGPLALFIVVGPLGGATLLVATNEQWYGPLASMSLPPQLALFLGVAIAACGLSLVPTHAASLVAGMLFGAAWGSTAALAAIACAAVLGHAVLSRIVGDTLVARLAQRPRARAVHQALVHESQPRSAFLLALVRLSPVMPFAGTNLLMAAVGQRLPAFLAGTVAGIAPRVVVVATAGAGLSELDLSQSGDQRLALIGAAATLVALVAVSLVARRALRAATAGAAAQAGAPDALAPQERNGRHPAP